MICKLILIIFLLPSFAFASCLDCHAIQTIKINEEVIKVAKEFSIVREKTNNNDDPEIDRWLKNCGLGKGYSYCAAFTVYMYKLTYERNGLKSPLPNIAGVANFANYANKHPFEFKMISTKKMNWGIDTPEAGDLISWKHGSSIFNGFGYMGHQGITIKPVPKLKVDAIEGNTKAGAGGDQSGTVKGDMRYGHEGVYYRTRGLGLDTTFPIMYFIRLNKRTYELTK